MLNGWLSVMLNVSRVMGDMFHGKRIRMQNCQSKTVLRDALIRVDLHVNMSYCPLLSESEDVYTCMCCTEHKGLQTNHSYWSVLLATYTSKQWSKTGYKGSQCNVISRNAGEVEISRSFPRYKVSCCISIHVPGWINVTELHTKLWDQSGINAIYCRAAEHCRGLLTRLGIS